MGHVEQAVAAVRAGQPVILPTDTVYGLCADPYREEPVARVYRLKGRPETVPSALVAADVDVLLDCIPELYGRPAVIARALLPGPYTLVLPNPGRRFRWLNGLARDTIGVRVPVLVGEARQVFEQVGALMATSANRHRGIDPRRLDDVPLEIRDACGAVVDGGELPGKPSTVIDLTGPEPRVTRAGAVPAPEALRHLALVTA
jgi:L-threonylcarbamoyladenylate synthase